MSPSRTESGAILVNVITEELPDRTSGRIAPYLLGAGVFLIVDLAMRSLPMLA